MSSFEEAREALLLNHDMKVINDNKNAFVAGRQHLEKPRI